VVFLDHIERIAHQFRFVFQVQIEKE